VTITAEAETAMAVAIQACQETGIDPAELVWETTSGLPGFPINSPAHKRAVLLGMIAGYGRDVLLSCDACWDAGRPPCTPAHELLGREAATCEAAR
jgi:hypothetical protein